MSNIIHQIATCTECKWQCDDYKVARKQGRLHAKKTGHKVIGETGTAWDYHFPKIKYDMLDHGAY